jgi:hypothetical protein
MVEARGLALRLYILERPLAIHNFMERTNAFLFIIVTLRQNLPVTSTLLSASHKIIS